MLKRGTGVRGQVGRPFRLGSKRHGCGAKRLSKKTRGKNRGTCTEAGRGGGHLLYDDGGCKRALWE